MELGSAKLSFVATARASVELNFLISIRPEIVFAPIQPYIRSVGAVALLGQNTVLPLIVELLHYPFVLPELHLPVQSEVYLSLHPLYPLRPLPIRVPHVLFASFPAPLMASYVGL